MCISFFDNDQLNSHHEGDAVGGLTCFMGFPHGYKNQNIDSRQEPYYFCSNNKSHNFFSHLLATNYFWFKGCEL